MNTPPGPVLRFLILIPHKDCNKILCAYRRDLFTLGLSGAWSFPDAVPLAQVSRPFSREELKGLAHTLRELSIHDNRDGKFHSAGTALSRSPEIAAFSFFGIKLDFSKPLEGAENLALMNRKIIHTFNSLCLCTALLSAGVDTGRASAGELPAAPEFSFRAASVANLAMRPLSSGEAPYSWEWKISAPAWLPAYKKTKG